MVIGKYLIELIVYILLSKGVVGDENYYESVDCIEEIGREVLFEILFEVVSDLSY